MVPETWVRGRFAKRRKTKFVGKDILFQTSKVLHKGSNPYIAMGREGGEGEKVFLRICSDKVLDN